MVEGELKGMGNTWGTVDRIAKDCATSGEPLLLRYMTLVITGSKSLTRHWETGDKFG